MHLIGPFARACFSHHFLRQYTTGWSGPVDLCMTPDGHLSVKFIDRSHPEGGSIRTFDFETDHSLDVDLRPKLDDESFISRTVPHLGYTADLDALQEQGGWKMLARLLYGFELLPGCWLHATPNPRALEEEHWTGPDPSFLIVDPERYDVIADPASTEWVTENGYHQIHLPNLLANGMNWLDQHEDHEPHIGALGEALNRIIRDKTTLTPFALAKRPCIFVWERYALPSP